MTFGGSSELHLMHINEYADFVGQGGPEQV